MKNTIKQAENILRGRKSLQYLAEYAEWVWYTEAIEDGTIYSERFKKENK